MPLRALEGAKCAVFTCQGRRPNGNPGPTRSSQRGRRQARLVALAAKRRALRPHLRCSSSFKQKVSLRKSQKVRVLDSEPFCQKVDEYLHADKRPRQDPRCFLTFFRPSVHKQAKVLRQFCRKFDRLHLIISIKAPQKTQHGSAKNLARPCSI